MSASKNIWEFWEPVFFLLLTVYQLMFLSRLLLTEISFSLGFSLLSIALLVSVSIHVARHFRLFDLHMLMLMMILGNLGMLLGSILDFGMFGLLSLVSLCTSQSDFGVVQMWSKVSIAPWTYIGMLLGCNLGMLISRWSLRYRKLKGARDVVNYILCNVGMVTGMLLAEIIMLQIDGATGTEMAIFMILLMLTGMAIGMLSSRWLVMFALSCQQKFQVFIGRVA